MSSVSTRIRQVNIEDIVYSLKEAEMAAARIGTFYDYFLSFIVEKTTPAQILAFQIPEETADRARLLLDKQDADALTTEEIAELNEMQEVDQLVSVLKAKALTVTSGPDDRRRYR